MPIRRLGAMPIRTRLTAAFAAAVIAVLTCSGLFVYGRLSTDLDDAIDAGLRARSAAAIKDTQAEGPGAVSSTPLEDPGESFVQLLDLSGRLQARAGTLAVPALAPGEQPRTGGELRVERNFAGVDGRARVLAKLVPDGSGRIVVVGQSLVNRDEALGDLRNSFALAGPIAVLIASLVGSGLARLGLRPVEAMRRTAGEVSTQLTGRRLPLPKANDEIRRLGETLNDMLDRLEQSSARMRSFVSDASHELRTPIAVIKVELESALRSGDFGPRVGESLKAALEECDNIAQLAEDLLVIARTSESGFALTLEPLAVREVLQSVRQRFLDRATARGREIVVHVVDDPVALGDHQGLRQLLGNLVDNALRHGRGTITLRGSGSAGQVDIEVCDEGVGFAPDIADRAFDRFARGRAALAGSGAGLGLAIVRALAEAQGGNVKIVAAEQTSVRVSLPTPSLPTPSPPALTVSDSNLSP